MHHFFLFRCILPIVWAKFNIDFHLVPPHKESMLWPLIPPVLKKMEPGLLSRLDARNKSTLNRILCERVKSIRSISWYCVQHRIATAGPDFLFMPHSSISTRSKEQLHFQWSSALCIDELLMRLWSTRARCAQCDLFVDRSRHSIGCVALRSVHD